MRMEEEPVCRARLPESHCEVKRLAFPGNRGISHTHYLTQTSVRWLWELAPVNPSTGDSCTTSAHISTCWCWILFTAACSAPLVSPVHCKYDGKWQTWEGAKPRQLKKSTKQTKKTSLGITKITKCSLKQITYSNEQKKPKKPPLEKVFSARIELGRQLSPFWRISASQNLSKLFLKGCGSTFVPPFSWKSITTEN